MPAAPAMSSTRRLDISGALFSGCCSGPLSLSSLARTRSCLPRAWQMDKRHRLWRDRTCRQPPAGDSRPACAIVHARLRANGLWQAMKFWQGLPGWSCTEPKGAIVRLPFDCCPIGGQHLRPLLLTGRQCEHRHNTCYKWVQGLVQDNHDELCTYQASSTRHQASSDERNMLRLDAQGSVMVVMVPRTSKRPHCSFKCQQDSHTSSKLSPLPLPSPSTH